VPAGSLKPFFAARGIAVVGASADEKRTGGRTMAVLAMTGYRGVVHPVNPRYPDINGSICYPDISAVPDPVDLAILCLAAEKVPEAIRACGRRGIPAAVVFADGFSETRLGAELRQALSEARALSGLRLIGPNTVGVRCVTTGVYPTFATDVGTGGLPGSIATIGHSGGLTVYFGSAYLQRRGIGSKYIIDTGAAFDVDVAEALEYVAEDEEITCAALLMEGCRDGARLCDAVGRMVAQNKSVVVWKMGRSRAGREQVASHTGALAGETEIFESVLRDHGAIIVDNETELVDCLTIAAAGRVPKGRRLGIVTPSGGYAIATLDAAERFGMEVPPPELPPTVEQRGQLGVANLHNPLDYSASIASGPMAERAGLEWMAAQPNLDAILLWQAYANLNPARRDKLRNTIIALTAQSRLPVFGCGITTPEFEEELRSRGVVWFEEPTRLVRALSMVAPPNPFEMPADAVPAANGEKQQAVISGVQARRILSTIQDLPQVKAIDVPNPEEARAHQERWNTEIFLKLESDHVPHKTELGLVVGPLGAEDISAAFAGLAAKLSELPNAKIVAQPAEHGVELAFGMRDDPIFGAVVMVATGGIFIEVLHDAVFASAPFDIAKARQMIMKLKCAPLLLGARGKPPADIDAVAAALAGFSEFAAAKRKEYREMDVNPVIVRRRGQGVVAVDALLIPSSGD
jgi:acyl-CoA synthetase (NDP forming)